MSTSTQTYTTDILQEHPDSTLVLIDRIHNWKRTISYLESYISFIVQAQSGVSGQLEKARKHLADEPQFAGSRASGTTVAEGPVGLLSGFSDLQQRNEQLYLESENSVQTLKNVVLQNLTNLHSELDKQYKVIKSDGQKGIKEIEKSREATQKLVEKLGKFTSSFGTSKIDSKDDPYVLNRRIISAVNEQVNAENVQAESALAIQNKFSSLEQHVISSIQQAIAKLDGVLTQYGNALVGHSNAVNKSFQAINPSQEWADFTEANKAVLVPSQNFRRDPQNVTFSNKDHASTRAVIEGPLRRKGTVLKSWNTAYYVLTPAGFLHQFKSQESIADPTPELSLYLPEGQLGPMPSRASGEVTFKLIAKDPSKTLSRSHKYTFKGSSWDDLELWYSAISKVIGGQASEDVASRAESPDVSPVTPTAGLYSEPAAGAVPAAGAAPAATAVPAATAAPATAIKTETPAAAHRQVPAVPLTTEAAVAPQPAVVETIAQPISQTGKPFEESTTARVTGIAK